MWANLGGFGRANPTSTTSIRRVHFGKVIQPRGSGILAGDAALDLAVAGIGSRFLALAIDVWIQTLIAAVVGK